MSRIGILLDRDGVINVDQGYNYVTRWEDFIFLDGVKKALAQLQAKGMIVAVITNQSCIGKGIVPANTVETIHQQMAQEIEKAGGQLAGIYLCPHTDADQCDCRKPKPGLLLEAMQELKLKPEHCFFVGDSARDIEAGRQAGCHTVLVKTGKGAEELENMRRDHLEPDYVFNNLTEVADWLTTSGKLHRVE